MNDVDLIDFTWDYIPEKYRKAIEQRHDYAMMWKRKSENGQRSRRTQSKGAEDNRIQKK